MVAVRIAALCLALVVGVGCKKKSPASDTYTAPGAGSALTSMPEIKRPVTDLANVLSATDTESIARELVEHQTATGVQLAVLIVATTANQPIDDFAQQVFNAWGGGSAERNDGALFVLAITDRHNRLHLGYGLEPLIPDASAKRMLDALRPHLRAANYAAATRELIDGFRARTGHLTPGGPRQPPFAAYPWMWIVVVVIGLLAGLAWAFAFRHGRIAWRKRPARWDYQSRPRWYVRAGAAIVDFFRYRPVALTVAGILGVHFLLRYLFRFGDGQVTVYSFLYWGFFPLGWLMGVRSKLVSVATALFAITFVAVSLALSESVLLTDRAMLLAVVGPLLAAFGGGGFVMLFIVAGIADGVSGRGRGSNYSSSSRSSSSSSSSRSSSSTSSSYSSRSYSGGGGRSGGGGASSSW